MDWLRKLVSGKRRRFEDQKYNLDMTYITQRVLAMSFPASGFEQMYRNKIFEVAEFLGERHGTHYRVFNMSGRTYDFSKFDNRVESFEWQDHHSPALHILFQACMIMHIYLKSHPENVVVVHCNAGKGRTGTLISCYLIFSGLASNAKDAIQYYGWKRFRHGRGVTQPSQVRYVYYFEQVYKRMIKSPMLKSPEKIIIHTIPDVAGNQKCKPFVDIINGIDFELIWTNKDSMNLKQYSINDQKNINQYMVIQIDQIMHLCSDLYFRIKHKGSFKNKLVCRFALNPAFIADNVIHLNKNSVDPDAISKDCRYSDDFKVEIHFKNICPTCTSTDPISSLCKQCQERMSYELSLWALIHEILDNHEMPSFEKGALIHFRQIEKCDFKEIQSKFINVESFEDIERTTTNYAADFDDSEYESDVSINKLEQLTDELSIIASKKQSTSDSETKKRKNTIIQKLDYDLSSDEGSLTQEYNPEMNVIQEVDEEEKNSDKNSFKQADDRRKYSQQAQYHNDVADDQNFDQLMNDINTNSGTLCKNSSEKRKLAIREFGQINYQKQTTQRQSQLQKTRTIVQKGVGCATEIQIIPSMIPKRSKSSHYYGDKFQLQKQKIKQEYEKNKIKMVIQTKRRQTYFRPMNQVVDKSNLASLIKLKTKSFDEDHIDGGKKL